MRLKPKVMVDIASPEGRKPFSAVMPRLSLAYKGRTRKIIIPLKVTLSVLAVMLTCFMSSVIAPTWETKAETMPSSSERESLEKELQELESQIDEYERTVSEYQKQGSTLKGEISRLNSQISKLNLQVKSINLNLSKLDKDIAATTNRISITESDMERKKSSIASALRDIDRSEDKNLLEIMLANPSLSDFFKNVNDLVVIQNSLQENLKQLEELHEEYVSQKEDLGVQRSDAATLKAYQEAQRKSVESLKGEKDNILKVTKGKEAEYQKVLVATKKTAAEIRNRLFHLLGGGEMTFAQAYEYASYAERSTGIRAAMLLAVLDQESALGKNVGKCDYQDAMHPRRDTPIFLEIISELNLQSDLENGKIKVSCAIVSDGAYGGAMGPAQFIPSTWNLYKRRIADITGQYPPNPWNNRDAFVATSLYLKDAYDSADCANYGAKNSNIAPEKTLRERCAAAKYYAGSRWYTYRFAYGEPVLDRAEKFEADIAILNSNQSNKR